MCIAVLLQRGPGPTQEQSGWSFRVVEDGSEFVLQKLAGDELLATRFSLPGFTLAADGRLVLTNAG